jgi:type IV pilus assembly protein PilB
MASAIEEQLVKIKRDSEEREAIRKAEELGLDYLDLSTKAVTNEALETLSKEDAGAAQVVPVELKGQGLMIALVDPKNNKTQEVLSSLKSKGFNLTLYLSSRSSIKEAQKSYDTLPKKQEEITGEFNAKEKNLEELAKKLINLEVITKEIKDFNLNQQPIGDILEIVLAGAVTTKSSDVHFEPEIDKVKIRYRIDGILNTIIDDFPSSSYKSLLSRIKLLTGLKIDISGKAQDGRFSIVFGDKDVELRVSIVPSEHGETVVMRILDPDAINISLEGLGLRKDDLEIVMNEIQEPNGMILNTGPTGSGKTTTLYSFLKQRHSSEIKIVTIEDPIEYNIDGIEQTQVSEERGYTFANGLSAIMRQDPDVILVGEIRDGETANVAIQAALTGHLVFSTVHANEAAGSIPRLLDLNIKPTSIGPALNMIMAQRLVRKLCEICKKQVEIDDEIRVKIAHLLTALPERVDKVSYQTPTFFKAVGCNKCNQTGYKGRIGIFELLQVKQEIESLIEKQASETELQEFALKQGMVTMQQDGLLKVLIGITTLEEVKAATGSLNF